MSKDIVVKHNTTESALAVKQEQQSIAMRVKSEMPVFNGIDDENDFRFKLPRAGKIHLGYPPTDTNKFPQKADHFVLPEELKSAGGLRTVLEMMGQDPDKPKKLPIMLMFNSIVDNVRHSLDLYGSSRGLKCRSYDAISATRVDEKTGELHNISCAGKECHYFKSKQCHTITRLRVMLPDAPGIGYWQIDTTSTNNRFQLPTEIMQLKTLLKGNIAGIPLILSLDETKKTIPIERSGTLKASNVTVYLLHITTPMSLYELRNASKFAFESSYDANTVQDFDMEYDNTIIEPNIDPFEDDIEHEELTPIEAEVIDDESERKRIVELIDEVAFKILNMTNEQYATGIEKMFGTANIDDLSIQQLEISLRKLNERASKLGLCD